MILGAFTLFHVLLSLAGIISGFVVAFGLLTAKRLEGWTAVFLWTTVATQRDRVPVPVPSLSAVSRSRHSFVNRSGGGVLCALYTSARWCVAAHLRGYRDDRPLPECFRLGRAALHESAGPQGVSTNAVGAAV